MRSEGCWHAHFSLLTSHSRWSWVNMNGFTLVEILVSITLLGIVLTSAYAAFQSVIIQQWQIDAQVDINRDVYYYTEKFFDLIQSSGNIDYEEYWNRRVLGYNKSFHNDIYTYDVVSEFGNSGTLFSCISTYDTIDIRNSIMRNENYPTDNCFTGSHNNLGTSISWQQIYGQYSELFFDRNKNANDDGGDEDGDGEVRWDQDDRDTWLGPSVIDPIIQDTWISELYLAKQTDAGIQRTYFRFILEKDSTYIADHPWIDDCNPSSLEWCIGTVQMLRLVGVDADANGTVDSWTHHPEHSDMDDWIDLFPPYINVVDMSLFITPTKNPVFAWNTPSIPQDNGINVQSSVRIRLAVELAYERQRRANRDKDTFQTRHNFTTIINLGTLGNIQF